MHRPGASATVLPKNTLRRVGPQEAFSSRGVVRGLCRSVVVTSESSKVCGLIKLAINQTRMRGVEFEMYDIDILTSNPNVSPQNTPRTSHVLRHGGARDWEAERRRKSTHESAEPPIRGVPCKRPSITTRVLLLGAFRFPAP